jgi:hypothetical protein
MKKLTLALMALALLFSFSSCEKDVEKVVEKVEVTPATLTLEVGATAELKATVTPDQVEYTLAWTSSNTAIATVDNSGKVTAVAEGTATITAEAGGKTANCAVTVKKPAPTSFEDSFEDATLGAWTFIQGNGTAGDLGNAFWYPRNPGMDNVGAAYDGSYDAFCDWGYNIDSWLITPEISITETTKLNFAFKTSYYWMVDPNPNGDLFVKVSTDGGNTWTQLWREEDYGTFDNFVWCPVTLSLSSYAGQVVKIAFQNKSDDNASVEIDAVNISPNATKLAYKPQLKPQVSKTAKSLK